MLFTTRHTQPLHPNADDAPLDELLACSIDIACVRLTLKKLGFTQQRTEGDEHHFVRTDSFDGPLEEVVVRKSEDSHEESLILTWTVRLPKSPAANHTLTLHDSFIDTSDMWLHVAQLLRERPSGLRPCPLSEDIPPLHISQLIAE